MATYTTFETEFGDEIEVAKLTRSEAIEQVEYWIDQIEQSEYSTDLYIWVEYKDGTNYSNYDGDISGRFHRNNIKGIIMDDGYMYYIYGKYEIRADIPELI